MPSSLSPFAYWQCLFALHPSLLDDLDQRALCEELLEQAGALSISFEPAQEERDHPLLWETRPGETIWSACSRMKVLFSGEKARPLLEAWTQDLAQKLSPLGCLLLSAEFLADKEWSRAWLDHFHPQKIADNFWIIPSTEQALPPEAIPQKDQTIHHLFIDPGLAFGSGTHPTTLLCLKWIATHPEALADKTVLDLGCGSGILSIAAGLMGAHTVLAVDHDPQALLSTQENRKKNPAAEPQTFVLLDRLPDKNSSPGLIQVVLANILLEPLLDLAKELSALLTPGGYVVLSGILETQVPLLREGYRQYNIEFTNSPQIQDGWALLVGSRL